MDTGAPTEIDLLQSVQAPITIIMHATFCCFSFVFLTVGVCSYFLGCNHNYDSQCYGYDVVRGTAYAYKFTSETCKECVTSECDKWRKYPCYSAYVKFHYGSNFTCNFAAKFESKSEIKAHNSVKSYPIGYKMKLLEREGSSSNCLKASAGMNEWITGVAFLSLTGLIALCWMFYGIISWAQDSLNVHHSSMLPSAEVEIL